MATTTQQRRRHTETESGYASLIGAGLLFIMLAFGLSAVFGGTPASSERFNLFLIGGVLALVAFTIMWAFHLRPWRHFDDWKTPLYTGHEAHADVHHEEAHEDASESQMIPSAQAEAQLADMHSALSTVTVGNLETEAHTEMVPSAEAVAKLKATQTTPAVTVTPDKLSSSGAMEQETVDTSLQSMPTTSKDNLQLLEGIGPKIAEALNNAGVLTFAQLADMQPSELEKIVRDAGVRMVGHGETWPEQARLAADGKFEELKVLKDQLSSGRR